MLSGASISLLILGTVNLCLCQLETVTVEIEQGEVRGNVATTVNGLKYYSFLGVPYAKPPIGNLRFKSPQPADPWDGIHDALEEGAPCPQFAIDLIEDEDCLFINVYAPEFPENGTVALKPVMVHIHGGGFSFGSGSLSFSKSDFILEENIVVVSFNYRLGALGFLSTGDSVVPGNNGLKDQVLALRWVQQNIAKFGGDPNSVTIFGISAGGSSVHHLVLSPAGAGLFHKGIVQSGTAINSWSHQEPEIARAKASRLCEVLGNATTNSNEMIEFLRSISAREITEASMNLFDQTQYETTIMDPVYFGLTTEHDVEPGEIVFLEDAPINIIRSGNFNHVPLVAGGVTHEGSLFLGVLSQNNSYLDIIDKHPEMMVPNDVKVHLSSEEITALGNKIKHFYFGNEPVSLKKLIQFINLGTDFVILFGIDRLVSLHAAVSKAPVYQYQFTFDGRWGSAKFSNGDSLPAVAHGDEAFYLFYVPPLKYNDNSPESVISKRIVKLWTNFAKTGNPTPEADSVLQNVTWSPATALDNFYLDIGNDLVVKRNLLNDRMSLWEDIYASVSG